MFIIELTYKVPLERVDERMKEHMAFLNTYYQAGKFLLSGRKVPRDGGIILALADSREQIEAIMREDPFCQEGLADVRVTEFQPGLRAENIDQRIPKS
jgi:uncharacterized protein YciI